MGRATSEGNEAKSKTKKPSDSNTGGSDLWSNTLPLDDGGAPFSSPTIATRMQDTFHQHYYIL